MNSILADILGGTIVSLGGCTAVIFLYLTYKIRIANPGIWERNRRISQLTKKYNRNESTPGENKELESLYRQGLVTESVFIRKGELFHRYDLADRAFVEILR